MKLKTAYNLIKEDSNLLYRGSIKDRSYKNPNKGAIYFSPNKEYALEYGDSVITTKMPYKIFDPRKSSDRQVLYKWIMNKIKNFKEADSYWDNPSSLNRYLNDAQQMTQNNIDSAEKILSGLINLGIYMAGGFSNYTTGEIEKTFMEENNINCMYMIESGNTKDKPNSEWSVAFREMPKITREV